MAEGAEQWASFEKVDTFLSAHGSGHALEAALLAGAPATASNRASLNALLGGFVRANEESQHSPNLRRADEEDPFQGLLCLLRADDIDTELALLSLRALKVLCRKRPNRLAFGEEGVAAALRHLRDPSSLEVAAEAANVLLNACYETENVDAALRQGAAAAAVAALGDKPVSAGAPSAALAAQANAAGAIQSICYQAHGRKAVRECGAVGPLVAMLASQSVKVRMRAAGAVHNMSSDAEAIRAVRMHGGIPLLVALLESPQPAVAASAAGALQNVSREAASRKLIRESDAVPALMGLLFGDEMQAQRCAAGALLNILGPEAGPSVDDPRRKALGKLLSQGMALSHAYSTAMGEAFAPQPEASVERLSRAMAEARIDDQDLPSAPGPAGADTSLAAMLGAPAVTPRARPKSGRRAPRSPPLGDVQNRC